MTARVAQEVIATLNGTDTRRVLVDVRGLTVRVAPRETFELISSYPRVLKTHSSAKTAVLYKRGDEDIM